MNKRTGPYSDSERASMSPSKEQGYWMSPEMGAPYLSS